MKNFIRLSLLAFVLFAAQQAQAASRFAVCSVTCTWDGSSTAMWSASTGGATGASVPGTSDTVTLDASTCVGGVTCTITTNTNPSIQSLTMGACTASTTGCILDFSANNNNITLLTSTGFSGTGTGTRQLKMGNGTWTLSSPSTSTLWTMATTTNLTFNANASTIDLTGAAASGTLRTFAGGGLTYGTVRVSGGGIGASVAISGNNTIATLTNTVASTISLTGTNTITTLTPSAQLALYLTNATTQTITNAFTMTGSLGAPNSIIGVSPSAVSTISIASGTTAMDSIALRSITFSGGGTFNATNGYDLGNNTGVTITAPSGSGGGGRIIGG